MGPRPGDPRLHVVGFEVSGAEWLDVVDHVFYGVAFLLMLLWLFGAFDK